MKEWKIITVETLTPICTNIQYKVDIILFWKMISE